MIEHIAYASAKATFFSPMVLSSFLVIILILVVVMIITTIMNGVVLFNMAQTLRRTEDFHLGFVGHPKAQFEATFFQKRIFKLFRKLSRRKKLHETI